MKTGIVTTVAFLFIVTLCAHAQQRSKTYLMSYDAIVVIRTGAGYHFVEFDFTGFARGVYFIRLVANSAVQSAKYLLSR